MTGEHRLERLVADALQAAAPNATPGLVPDVLQGARKTRRRPRWLALMTERPMRRHADVLVGSPAARTAAAMLAAVLMFVLGTVALVAGGIVPKPDLAVVVTPSDSMDPIPTLNPTAAIGFRPLDTPAIYSGSSAEAVDGTTAVGWVQGGIADAQPAIWDTTTGALRVLAVPAEFINSNGDTGVRLVGVSGTTAVGTGILGTTNRGQSRAMAWNTVTGELRILDIPTGFAQAEAHAISGTTAVGRVTTAHGEDGRPVAWDTETGAVRILDVPTGYELTDPRAISGTTIVGIRTIDDLAVPVIWNALTAEAHDLDVLPTTTDGIPRAVDGSTAVGNCCFGEEGTPLPLAWDTATGSVRQLDLPAEFAHGRAQGVSGNVAIGNAEYATLIWDLTIGDVEILPAPAGYDAEYAATAVNGRTIVGYACPPAPSTSENPRCIAAAWTLP